MSFTKLPFPVAGLSWTAGGLIEGDTYEIYLGTTKGVTEGVFSATQRFTVMHAPAHSVPR